MAKESVMAMGTAKESVLAIGKDLGREKAWEMGSAIPKVMAPETETETAREPGCYSGSEDRSA